MSLNLENNLTCHPVMEMALTVKLLSNPINLNPQGKNR